MKTIAVDMDGVLADVYSQFIRLHALDFGKTFTLDEVSGVTCFQMAENMLIVQTFLSKLL